jgi:hypothetical protein
VTGKRPRTEAEIASWRAADAEQNERARVERLRRDGSRSPTENLADGIALARMAGAFFGSALPERDT